MAIGVRVAPRFLSGAFGWMMMPGTWLGGGAGLGENIMVLSTERDQETSLGRWQGDSWRSVCGSQEEGVA